MAIEAWIDLFKWVIGGIIVGIIILITAWNNINTRLNKVESESSSIGQILSTLSDLKTGQELTHQQLEQLDKSVNKIQSEYEKVYSFINQSHSELMVLQSEMKQIQERLNGK